MKEFDGLDLGIAFCVGVILSSVASWIGDTEHRGLQKQAIDRGHAEYVIDSDGKTTWQWKESK